MNSSSTSPLSYATPSTADGAPPFVPVLLTALLIPGLASVMMRGRARALWCVALLAALAATTWLFVYAWPGLPLPSRVQDDDIRALLYFTSIVAVVAASVVGAVRDWRHLQARAAAGVVPRWGWWVVFAVFVAAIVAGVLLALMAMVLAAGFSSAK